MQDWARSSRGCRATTQAIAGINAYVRCVSFLASSKLDMLRFVLRTDAPVNQLLRPMETFTPIITFLRFFIFHRLVLCETCFFISNRIK